MAVVAWVAAWSVVVLTTVTTLLGLAIVDVVDAGHVGTWDVAPVRWLASHRTPGWDRWSSVGSSLATTVVVLVLAVLVVGVLVATRHRDRALLVAVGLAIEVTTFLLSSFLVGRPRPPVAALDHAPPTSSYPSGHTAAAVVLYVGVVVVVRSLTRRRAVRAGVLLLGAVPVVVAVARLYRGMHHPTDVVVGAALGAASLAGGLLALRAGVAVARLRALDAHDALAWCAGERGDGPAGGDRAWLAGEARHTGRAAS